MADPRRAPRRARVLLAAMAMAALAVLGACGGSPGRRSSPAGHPGGIPSTTTTSKPPAPGTLCPCPDLAAGSDPSVLPSPILVADHMNNRLLIVDPNGTVAWEFPRPGDLAPGQSFAVPDDAFFTPDGKDIVVTEEDDYVIRMVDVASHRIVWTYGTPGVPGSGPDHLWNPDDAMMQPNGDVIAADIKNCRVVILRPGAPAPLHVYGTTGAGCQHDPPARWGSPNGAFPMTDGNYLVTEINGDWVDELTQGGQVVSSAHPPGVAYPSDTNEVRPGVLLTVDYSNPGQVLEFDPQGRLLWRFAPTGPDALNKPSLALPLPNGDVLCNDDSNDRVIVIDPRSDRIVWQYGHTGVSGSGAGYLNVPDGLDLLPPLSLTMTHAHSMGR
ncbi:MAG TPA: hypothetical protein VFH58_05650 [Acidimicrobiales bacterium]|nr:hypothetical protein [Acidimicrobiales bacterium]